MEKVAGTGEKRSRKVRKKEVQSALVTMPLTLQTLWRAKTWQFLHLFPFSHFPRVRRGVWSKVFVDILISHL